MHKCTNARALRHGIWFLGFMHHQGRTHICLALRVALLRPRFLGGVAYGMFAFRVATSSGLHAACMWFSSGMPQAHNPCAAQDTSEEIRDFASGLDMSDEHMKARCYGCFEQIWRQACLQRLERVGSCRSSPPISTYPI